MTQDEADAVASAAIDEYVAVLSERLQTVSLGTPFSVALRQFIVGEPGYGVPVPKAKELWMQRRRANR